MYVGANNVYSLLVYCYLYKTATKKITLIINLLYGTTKALFLNKFTKILFLEFGGKKAFRSNASFSGLAPFLRCFRDRAGVFEEEWQDGASHVPC